jgi:hypothetical protein
MNKGKKPKTPPLPQQISGDIQYQKAISTGKKRVLISVQ